MRSQFEKIANTDQKGFFGVYHVSMGQPESVCDAFENFIQRIIQEESIHSRKSSNDSRFYADETLKSRMCICRDLIDNFEEDSCFDYKNGTLEKGEFRQHHPHCPIRRKQNLGT